MGESPLLAEFYRCFWATCPASIKFWKRCVTLPLNNLQRYDVDLLLLVLTFIDDPPL